MKSELFCRNGFHGIRINGKEYAYAATRSFRPEGRILHDFSAHGIHFYNIFPSGIMTALQQRTVPYSQFGPVWEGPGKYNWENLRAQCDEFFPNLGAEDYVSITVHLDPPQWFVDSHPELVDHWEQMIQNLGSTEWKEAAKDYLCALIDKMDEWYPERVYAIFLLSGGTTEWYSYKLNLVVEQPTKLQRNTYKKYRNDPSREIPAPRQFYHAEDGMLRHPVIDGDSIDYLKFTNEITADTILYFAHAAKEHTHHSRLVGLFTTQTYGEQLDVMVRMTYNILQRLAESPDIDMIFTPASYIARKLDSTSGLRVSIDTMGLYGKLFVHEIDSATNLLKTSKVKNNAALIHAGERDEAFSCTEDTKMYLRRETGIVLAHGHGYWWFDMFSGYYDDPELMQEIEQLHELQNTLMEGESHSVSEIIDMLDCESNYYLQSGSYYPMAEHQLPLQNRARAPYDMSDTFALFHPDFPKDQYKLYFFPALFAPDERTRERIAQLRSEGRHMLFLHAPGYIDASGFSEASMQNLTGIHLVRTELKDNTIVGIGPFSQLSYDFTNATVTGDTWPNRGTVRQVSPVFYADNLDVVLGVFRENGLPAVGYRYREGGGIDFYSACAPVPTRLLTEMYRAAGIFLYINTDDPVYVSSGFECVYCYQGGDRILYRPEKSILHDYFTGEEFEVGPEGTTVPFRDHETRVFLVRRISPSDTCR